MAATFIMNDLLKRPKNRLMRLDVPGSLDDIVIVFVDDDPTLLEITETGAPAFDVGNFQRAAVW